MQRARRIRRPRAIVACGFSVAAALAAPLALGSAPAGAAGGGPTTCNFCVLDPSADHALQVTNGSILTVTGNLVVDSANNGAAQVASKSVVSASGAIGVVGGWQTAADSTTSPTPLTTTGASDCLASALTPTPSGVQRGTLDPTSGTVTAQPGNYQNLGSAGATVNLQPGLYTVTGSFTNRNGGTINGSNVFLYFPGSATLHLSANSTTSLNTGDPSSVLVFYDRANTQTIQIDKGATATLTGGLYAKSGQLSAGSAVINATCISVDKAVINNQAAITELPEGGTYGLLILLGLLGAGLASLFLLSTPRRVAARALARTRRQRAGADAPPQPLGPAPPRERSTPVGS